MLKLQNKNGIFEIKNTTKFYQNMKWYHEVWFVKYQKARRDIAEKFHLNPDSIKMYNKGEYGILQNDNQSVAIAGDNLNLRAVYNDSASQDQNENYFVIKNGSELFNALSEYDYLFDLLDENINPKDAQDVIGVNNQSAFQFVNDRLFVVVKQQIHIPKIAKDFGKIKKVKYVEYIKALR